MNGGKLPPILSTILEILWIENWIHIFRILENCNMFPLPCSSQSLLIVSKCSSLFKKTVINHK